jgi:hypothetical protein
MQNLGALESKHYSWLFFVHVASMGLRSASRLVSRDLTLFRCALAIIAVCIPDAIRLCLSLMAVDPSFRALLPLRVAWAEIVGLHCFFLFELSLPLLSRAARCVHWWLSTALGTVEAALQSRLLQWCLYYLSLRMPLRHLVSLAAVLADAHAPLLVPGAKRPSARALCSQAAWFVLYDLGLFWMPDGNVWCAFFPIAAVLNYRMITHDWPRTPA